MTTARKFTRRHFTTKLMTATLAAMTQAAKDHALAEKFILIENGGSCARIKLEGCDTHGPCRVGLAHDPHDFDACNAAESVLRTMLNGFSNLVITKDSNSFFLSFTSR